jgi:phosphoribosylaminoimidazolecarboxamide formyltransferase/IMP cyclohydrolase
MKQTKRRVLISVTNKEGVQKFGALTDVGWEIISTGGTAKALVAAGIPCTLIEDITGFPEMMDGRLKTLHPKIFGGILADRSKPEHMAAIVEHGIEPIDLVVVNLYAFDQKPGIENIDIGGPSLLRAAAKNASSVTVVVDPDDYDKVIGELLKTGGKTSINTRAQLATKVFEHTAMYDSDIHSWIWNQHFRGNSIFSDTEASTPH